jgi:hypothetical protein
VREVACRDDCGKESRNRQDEEKVKEGIRKGGEQDGHPSKIASEKTKIQI